MARVANKPRLNKENLVATEVEIIPSGDGYRVALVDYHLTFKQEGNDSVRFENYNVFKTYAEAHEFGFWWKGHR